MHWDRFLLLGSILTGLVGGCQKSSPAYLGAPPQVVEEAPRASLNQSSPLALLSSMLTAARAGDFNAIARAQDLNAGKQEITISDVQRAERDWGHRAQQPLREKVEKAMQQGQVVAEQQGESATLRVQVGGALGSVQLTFVQIEGQWYQHTVP